MSRTVMVEPGTASPTASLKVFSTFPAPRRSSVGSGAGDRRTADWGRPEGAALPQQLIVLLTVAAYPRCPDRAAAGAARSLLPQRHQTGRRGQRFPAAHHRSR